MLDQINTWPLRGQVDSIVAFSVAISSNSRVCRLNHHIQWNRNEAHANFVLEKGRRDLPSNLVCKKSNCSRVQAGITTSNKKLREYGHQGHGRSSTRDDAPTRQALGRWSYSCRGGNFAAEDP